MKAECLALIMVMLAACTAGRQVEKSEVVNLHGRCDVVQRYDIDFQRFDEAAQQIAHATGCFIETDDLDSIGAFKQQPIKGRYSPRQAITKAIEGMLIKIIK